MLHRADRVLFEALKRHAKDVPVVIVRTMKDIFMSFCKEQARERLKTDPAFQEESLENYRNIERAVGMDAKKELQNLHQKDMEEIEQEL